MTSDTPSQTKNLNNLLKNKVAFVMGAGSGIGRDGAMATASQGAHVVVTDLFAVKAHEVAKPIKSQGYLSSSHGRDVMNDKAFDVLFKDTVDKFGKLDILHSHAGYQIEGDLEQVSIEGMDLSWKINVRSHFIASRAVVGYMRKHGGGSIIITASNSGVKFDKKMIAMKQVSTQWSL